mmetsp:Transcript_65336/g.116219  ORF Transcript_65336/g.116219 Transcript_65336/m.116219 type:complete len:515 (-) Transcript_65336:165-1709(-)
MERLPLPSQPQEDRPQVVPCLPFVRVQHHNAREGVGRLLVALRPLAGDPIGEPVATVHRVHGQGLFEVLHTLVPLLQLDAQAGDAAHGGRQLLVALLPRRQVVLLRSRRLCQGAPVQRVVRLLLDQLLRDFLRPLLVALLEAALHHELPVLQHFPDGLRRFEHANLCVPSPQILEHGHVGVQRGGPEQGKAGLAVPVLHDEGVDHLLELQERPLGHPVPLPLQLGLQGQAHDLKGIGQVGASDAPLDVRQHLPARQAMMWVVVPHVQALGDEHRCVQVRQIVLRGLLRGVHLFEDQIAVAGALQHVTVFTLDHPDPSSGMGLLEGFGGQDGCRLDHQLRHLKLLVLGPHAQYAGQLRFQASRVLGPQEHRVGPGHLPVETVHVPDLEVKLCGDDRQRPRLELGVQGLQVIDGQIQLLPEGVGLAAEAALVEKQGPQPPELNHERRFQPLQDVQGDDQQQRAADRDRHHLSVLKQVVHTELVAGGGGHHPDGADPGHGRFSGRGGSKEVLTGERS